MAVNVTKVEQQLIAELCHQINSPLAAIRNALYLSACRSQDPDLLRYLTLADAEISSIADILQQARSILEETSGGGTRGGGGQRVRQSRRAAA